MNYKLGNLIEPIDVKNTDGIITDFYGININKEFMPTFANTDNLDPKKYKILKTGQFLFSGAQTGRDISIRIALFNQEKPVIVSPSYTIFCLNKEAENLLLPEYLAMLFMRKEMDRYGWFLSDSSIRSNLDWDRFCNIEIDLPSLAVQQKYVAVYQAMLANQQAYEQGLDDLKLVCDSYIEHLIKTEPLRRIGNLIKHEDTTNKNVLYGINDVKGISIQKKFIETKANLENVSLKPYLLVKPGHFAYVTVTSRNGEKITIAHNCSQDTYLVSSSYEVFSVEDESVLLPEYLALFFNRSEFDRYARFHSWGSAREVFSWVDLYDVRIPIPAIDIQQAIVNIYTVLLERRAINEQLKKQIKEICPILVRGAIGEMTNDKVL